MSLKIDYRLTILILLSYGISIIVFLTIFFIIPPPDRNISDDKVSLQKKVVNKLQTLPIDADEKQKKLCLSNPINKPNDITKINNCFSKHNKQNIITVNKQEEILPNKISLIFSYLYDSRTFIKFIYTLQIVAIWIQITLLLMSSIFKDVQKHLFIKWGGKNRLEEVMFHCSEWAVNSPPVLGIIGNVYSLAIFISGSKTQNLAEVFVKNFYDAAITTIVGGIFYVINLFINIRIINHHK